MSIATRRALRARRLGQANNRAVAERRREFYERHRDADLLVFDTRNHLPIGAIYYSPDWYNTPEMREQDLKNFFTHVAAAEFENGPGEE